MGKSVVFEFLRSVVELHEQASKYDRGSSESLRNGHNYWLSSRIPFQVMRLFHLKTVLLACVTAAAALFLVGCGDNQVKLSKSNPDHQAAVAFKQNCGMCHTLGIARSEGSATRRGGREAMDGPNFDKRPVNKQAVLYAIRNGGFSGKYMPQNLVTGREADELATFLAKYAGKGEQ